MTNKSCEPIKNKEAGLSLIEMVMVISIIGVLMGFVIIPSFKTTRAKVVNELRNLKSDFKYARNEAVLSGKVHRMVFDFQSNRYWLEETDHKLFHMEQFREEQRKKQSKEALAEQLKIYEDLAGEEVNSDKGEKLPFLLLWLQA